MILVVNRRKNVLPYRTPLLWVCPPTLLGRFSCPHNVRFLLSSTSLGAPYSLHSHMFQKVYHQCRYVFQKHILLYSRLPPDMQSLMYHFNSTKGIRTTILPIQHRTTRIHI